MLKVKSEEEIRDMDSAQLAEFAKHGKVHEYVIETITEGGIDGDMAYDLKDNELVAFADKEVKHQVLLKSARKKMMKKTTTSSTRGKNSNNNYSQKQTKEQLELSTVLNSYNEHSYLLIFACNKYPKTDKLNNLDCAVADGKLIEKTFKQHNFKVFLKYSEHMLGIF